MSHLLSVCLLFFSFHLWADNEPTILITADRIYTNFKKSTGSVHIINAKDISKSNTKSLEEVIQKNSDLTVNSTSIFSRGMEASHTLVVLDGVVLNDPSNPNRQFDLSKIRLNNIENIEILKGAQGLLYGSNAIGGVIVITSNKNRLMLPSTQVNFAIASHQTSELNLNQSNKLLNQNFQFGGGIVSSKGFSAAADTTHPNDFDGFKKLSANLSLFGDLSNDFQYDFRFHFLNDQNDLDKGARSDDPNYSNKSQEIFTKIDFSKIWNETIHSKLLFSKTLYTRRAFDSLDQYQTYDGSNFSKGLVNAVSFDNTIIINDYITSNINIGDMYESDFHNHNNNLNIYLYNKIENNQDTFNFGIRIDQNKIFKNHLTYKIGYSRNLNLFSLHTSFSTGFRAPSLNQLFDSSYGNRNLLPETSNSADLGLEYVDKNIKNSLVFFYNNLDNRLTYHPTTFKNINSGSVYSKGIEESFTYFALTELSNTTRLNITESFNRLTGVRLARRPELAISNTTQYSINQHKISSTLRFTGNKMDVDNNGNQTKVEKNFLIDLDYINNISKLNSVYFKIKNLLNKNYEEIWGYNTGGRQVTLGINSEF